MPCPQYPQTLASAGTLILQYWQTIPVVRPGEDRAALVPDDLLRIRKPIRTSPSRTSRVNTEACHTYAICRLGTSSNASDQPARVSPEIVVSVCLRSGFSCNWA